MDRVTFIIPTMGRSTLGRAVDSLKSQVSPNWNAIVAFDNRYDVNYTPDDDRVKVMKADNGGHAGLIRNFALDYVDTDWLAFLDDDDWVEDTYVRHLEMFSQNNPKVNLIIFTYKDVKNGNIIPPKRTRDFEACKVGISFAVSTSFVRDNNIRFTPYAVEDFRFLDECRKAGAKYLIPNEIQYYVGGRGEWLRKD